MPGGPPAFNVKGLTMLDNGKQQRDQLACYGAYGFGAEPTITGEQSFVIRAVEAAGETPAPREQEQLAAQHWAPALGLFLSTVAPATGTLDEIHAGEFENLSWVLEVFRCTQFRENGSGTHSADFRDRQQSSASWQ